MKKTLFLFFIFLIISSLTIFLTQKEDTKTTILTAQRNFAVENIEEVAKIFIANRNGQSVTLDRKQDYWQLNNKYRANPNAIQNLLATIQKVKIKYTPPKAAVKNIINDIATLNIKVEIYNKKEEKLKTYYVGGVTNDELGTYMIMEDAEQPFVTYMPSFDGSLRVRYMTDEMDWRDKALFQERLSNIQAVNVTYPKQKNNSFKIERQGAKFSISPFFNTTSPRNQQHPHGKIEQYLVGFERLVAEGFANNFEKKDSIRQLLPFSIIELKTINNQTQTIKLYPIIKKSKSGQIILSDEGSPIVEKYFADVNGEDFMLVQQLVFGKILWGYEGFF